MTDRAVTTPFATDARAEHLFPTLTADQMKSIAAHGRSRECRRRRGAHRSGRSQRPVLRRHSRHGADRAAGQPAATSGQEVIVEHRAGEFTGETNMLSGRPSLVRAWVTEAGEVIELDRTHLMALVQNDPELSDILMRAFILRRVELIAHGFGDAVLLGSNHCAGTLRIREFLSRNGHPHQFVDLDKETDVQQLLDRFQVGIADVPVVVARGGVVLKNPSTQQIAEALGFNPAIDESAHPRHRHCRRGSVWIGGRGLRRVRGTRRARARVERARRAGGIELENRELSRLSAGRERRGADRPRVQPGGEVCRQVPDRAQCRQPRLRSPALRRRDRQRRARAGAHGDHRDRRGVSEAADREPRALRRRRRVLRRHRDGSAAVPGRGGHRRRRRQLGGTGGGVPVRIRASTCTCWCRSSGLAESMSRYLVRSYRRQPAHHAAHRGPRSPALEGRQHLEEVRWARP